MSQGQGLLRLLLRIEVDVRVIQLHLLVLEVASDLKQLSIRLNVSGLLGLELLNPSLPGVFLGGDVVL